MTFSATINGFALNDPTNGVTIDGDIVGLGMPDIRTSSGVYSGRDGGYVGAQNYGMRNISIPGEVFGDNEAAYEATRAAFSAAVNIGGWLPLELTTNAGRQYVMNCKLIKLDMPFSNSPIETRYTLELVAPDPIIYDNSAGGWNTVPITPVRGGGITWPIRWPVTWAGSPGPVTALNSGGITMYPVVTLTGKMTNPVITNVTTNQFVSLNGLVVTGTVVIDMGAPSVLLDGGLATAYVSDDSQWIGLTPGNNQMRLTTSDSGDTVTGTVAWRTGYLSL